MNALTQLADAYKKQHDWNADAINSGINELYRRYVMNRKQDLADAAALGLALDALLTDESIDIDALSPQAIEAFHLAFPNLELETLTERSPEELEALVNAWKGKLFEVEVQDQLNAGMQVGDYQLQAGQYAELAESATQPGWDLRIINEDGTTAELVQLKSTDAESYINEALNRYPDIPIVATSEVSNHADSLDTLSTADISNADTTNQIHDAIADDNNVADALLPSAPGSVILATEAWQVMQGKKTVDQAIDSGGARVGVSAVAGGIGWLASLALGPVGAIVGLGASLYLNHKLKKDSTVRHAKHEKEINPRQQIPKPTATAKEARKAYQELENITGRLLLEYKP